MNYDNILQFKGMWRVYQARVLDRAEHYVRDGKIHIVAAPGSGKTTLGIELIRRLQGTALVLVPTITIREQWIARIKEAFLCDGVNAEAYLSQSLKNPRAITVTTYQALHSAMTQIQDGEEDYQGFSLLQVLQDAKVDTLCLDECHHLRSEWWKSLESLKEKLIDVTTIALTATPPYDSTPAMWNRYIAMCGEIDEEITTPELVKEGSLCPHQDYVYFNYPTKEEEKEVRRFEERSKAMTEKIMRDTQFLTYVRSHKGCIPEPGSEPAPGGGVHNPAIVLSYKTLLRGVFLVSIIAEISNGATEKREIFYELHSNEKHALRLEKNWQEIYTFPKN